MSDKYTQWGENLDIQYSKLYNFDKKNYNKFSSVIIGARIKQNIKTSPVSKI
jgi:hypothetical protein